MDNKTLEIKLNGKKLTFKEYWEWFIKSSQKQVSKEWLPKEKEMKQKKAFNWIRHIGNSLLKCKNDDEAMKYKEEFFKLANNQKVINVAYGKHKFINDCYDVNNSLAAIDIYFKGEWTPYNITLQRLQEVFIPALLKGLKKNEKN